MTLNDQEVTQWGDGEWHFSIGFLFQSINKKPLQQI